jgi:uncharacterized protein HemX
MSFANWIALGILLLSSLGLGGSILCFLMRIAGRLAAIATSLERIEKDLADNQAEHRELKQAVATQGEQLGRHDVRITTLEQGRMRLFEP